VHPQKGEIDLKHAAISILCAWEVRRRCNGDAKNGGGGLTKADAPQNTVSVENIFP
jgi:hypothetical protein